MGRDCVVDIVGIVDHHYDITLCARGLETGRRAASNFFFPVLKLHIKYKKLPTMYVYCVYTTM